MDGSGIPTLEQWRFNGFWLLDHLLGKQRVDRVLSDARARHSERVRAAIADGEGPRLLPLERLKDPGAAAFRGTVMPQNRPVVLEGAAREWPCCRKWTPGFFADNYGNREQVLIAHSPLEIHKKKLEGAEMSATSMKGVVENMASGGATYANFNPILNYDSELRGDLDVEWLHGHRNRLYANTLYQLFMGGAGTGTGLHGAMSSNLFVQVYGRKRWIFFSTADNPALEIAISREPCFHSPIDALKPDYEAHPTLKHLVAYETTLEPGDVLYNPPFFWHQTTNLTDGIGVSFKWSYLPSFVRASGMQSLLTFLATSPPIWKVWGDGDKYMSIYTHRRRSRDDSGEARWPSTHPTS